MEPGTGLATLAFVQATKELIVKIGGPAADTLGLELNHLTQNGIQNLKRIFDNARKRPGCNVDKNGSVPPRILKEVFDQGPYCDDEMTAEYFGGVLASSRSGNSRDDRGLTMLVLVKSLSNYQIRTHYVVYQIMRSLFLGQPVNYPKTLTHFKLLSHLKYILRR